MAGKVPLEGLRVSVVQGMTDALSRASTALYDKVVENASLTDHTLDQLAKLGHPYAVRSNRPPHSPAYLVHKQSGRLAHNIKIKRVNQYAYNIGVSVADVPYLLAVVYGTRYMVGRDFIRGALLDLDSEIRNIFSTALTLSVASA